MNDLNILFRQRIGFPEKETITFEKLDLVLEKTANAIPFENLCIIAKTTSDFTKENLINKILIRKEGGLCYDLNMILYLFLMENNFNVKIVRGVIFNSDTQKWSPTGRTHVSILLDRMGKLYLIVTGFGGNLPLKPVPLTGEIVSSTNGEFQVEKEDTLYGGYILKMKLRYKDNVWKIGYVLDSKQPVTNLAEINEIQKIISDHEQSPFNKMPLITRLTKNGSVTLTDSTLTQWMDGKMTKEQVDPHRFKHLAKKHFKLDLLK
ncbi:arylamine N-acetyltransferase [Neobacillus sp. PS3-40]|uniref:arylamine N-acetyltransferase family protein n=1 Tax=Neobacillus sp. PS3-40 TaxID=3070679 RepID=UPI0027DEC244|nr:arylamine N-acetyltransferase [Neobacillus sp. PS3-40]WML44125.1 arylamine N-acetyltransferase [Neobacillus sp. PS3-40]